MRILIHALAAKMGGAANYINTLAQELSQTGEHDYLFLVPEVQAPFLRGLPRISVLAKDLVWLRRLWFDQVELPRLLRRERIDVLYSTANFATFFCPCRQLLLVRNSLYFSTLYMDRILPQKTPRARLAESLRRFLARRSARAADVVITPSYSMLSELQAAVPLRAAQVSPYGVDRKRFSPAPRPFAPQGIVRLLFTSLYAEHKNLGTLLRALPQIPSQINAKCRLITTCDPGWEKIHNPIRQADRALALNLQQLGLLELTGVLTGTALDQLYGQADIFVYPSVIESFGHPLLEAMAAGLPVLAADVPINRELCGDAAQYFSPFDDADCARQLAAVMGDADLRGGLAQRGLERAEQFRWSSHVDDLLHAIHPGTTLVEALA
jgi:glycosyltransferase involved in cell wall biosynthesis